MKPFLYLVVVCFAFGAFALQAPKSTSLEQATIATQPLPSITFSSVGAVSSVQMSGTANWNYGSDQQTGTVTLQANANGQSRMLLQLSSGSRVETQNQFSDSQRQCTWSGIDAVVHDSASHHCWTDTVWFLPQITMQLGAGATDDNASATAAPDGKIVHVHHERHPIGVRDNGTAKLLAHLSAVDLDIDATSGLPLELNFAAHPDNDAGTDIPVQVQFSDYRSVNGVTMPFHIQKFINNSLVLDLQISTAQVQLVSSPASLSSLAQ
jgi:hypothetical protein